MAKHVYYKGFEILVYRDIADPTYYVWEIWKDGELMDDDSLYSETSAEHFAKRIIDEELLGQEIQNG